MERVAPAGHPVAQTKREHCERSVGLVTRLQGDVAAPEVVSEHIGYGGPSGVHVFIVQDGFIVVENKVPRATVDVTDHGKTCHQSAADQPMSQEGW